MKRVIVLFISLVVLLGCATVELPKLPRFEDSNAYLIKKSVEQINIVDTLSDFVSKNDKIVIASLENKKTSDNSITAVIEDVFLKQFIDKGYCMLERDNDMIYHLMLESDSSYLYKIGFNEIESDDNLEIPTKLLSADKIIGYRVLECGIVYEDIKRLAITEKDSLNRIAETILLFRTEDAKSGEILNISTARGFFTDRISAKNKDILKDFHFRHYRFGYPNVYGNPPQIEYGVTQEKEGGSSKEEDLSKGSLIIFGGLVATVVIIMALIL